MLSTPTPTTDGQSPRAGKAGSDAGTELRPNGAAWLDRDQAARLRPFDVLLRAVVQAHPLLAWCTPRNDGAEFERVLARWQAGEEASPRWVAPEVDYGQLGDARRRLAAARVRLSRERAVDRVLIEAYDDRFEELSRELEVIAAAFGPRITQAARGRFDVDPPDLRRDADTLARAWFRARPAADPAPLHRTDDADDPQSLLCQLQRAVTAAGAEVKIVVRARVGSLAATGDGVVVVASDRTTTAHEARRVALHEVDGHVLPRERGKRLAVGLASLGSARASEHEEGRALALEEEAGVLDAGRKQLLAARHLAARAVVEGAGFVEVMRQLRADDALGLDAALRVAFRVHRGAHASGDSVRGGLAREQVYLPALLAVRRALVAGHTSTDALGSARLSIDLRVRSGLDARG